jgi:signal peptidase I
VRELSSLRETIESIWVAIILAFVLRAFMVEAFVIPTGSMAPRLMGEHWQLVCPACGYDYAYGVPHPAPGASGINHAVRQTPTGAICPNCGDLFPSTLRRDYPRSGDRVLVMKYLYRFTEPEPWDVVVFRNPQNNRENYIKRLIGLPGETIEIVHGDIFVRSNSPDAPPRWRVRRKPISAQEAMWQVVFDNDYRPNMKLLRKLGAPPPRWEALDEAWDLSALDGRIFEFTGSERPAEVVFRAPVETFLPRYGYNHRTAEEKHIDRNIDICNDLKLSLALIPKAADTMLALSLSSFEHRFKGELHADGTAVLWYDPPDETEGNWVEWARKKLEPLQVGRIYQLALTHVDFRVTLWLDGQEVLSSSDEQYQTDYEALKERIRQAALYTRGNRRNFTSSLQREPRPIPAPSVAIAAQGGAMQLRHIKLHRDVYYTAPSEFNSVVPGPLGEYARRLGIAQLGQGWGTMDNPITLRKFERSDLDEFFMLGDNSPSSMDSRAWTSASPTLHLRGKRGEPLYQLGTVPRYNLIGKAFFVYWPAGFHVPVLPHLPILPNVGRMRAIR